MKIRLNYHKITDAPFEDNLEGCFVFEKSDYITQIITQIEKEIRYGTPTSFLVSGYRGSGKTSFLNKAKSKVLNVTESQDQNVIFVNLNLVNYTDYKFIIRSIIRGIYLSLEKQNLLKHLSKKDREEVELLYKRTFFNITDSTKISILNESSVKMDIKPNVKNFIYSSLSLGVFGINALFYKFIQIPNDYILFILSLIYFTFSSIKIGVSLLRKESDLTEKEIKSFYDDEIAEHFLKELLKKLSTQNIKTVFILDELDKIENDSDFNKLLKEMKPIMLANLASFILVTGQRLYYKFEDSHTIDDDMMASLFSKQIHVPLLPISAFHKIAASLLLDNTYAKSLDYTRYIDTLILKSNRLPRRFMNLIRNSLTWENDKAYIILPEKDPGIKNKSNLLQVMAEIEREEIKVKLKDLGVGYHDFFTTQIYIWIQKMQASGGSYFDESSILNEASYSKYPSKIIPLLKKLFEITITKLISNKLLERKQLNVADGGTQILYRWTKYMGIENEDFEIEKVKIKSNFLNSFIEVEKIARELFLLTHNEENESKLKGVFSIFKKLEVDGIFKDNYSSKSINSIVRLRNKTVHGEELRIDDIKKMEESRLDLDRLKTSLLSTYILIVVRQFNKKRENMQFEELTKTDNWRFDLAMKSSKKSSIYLFEILHARLTDEEFESKIDGLLNSFIRFNLDNETTDNYLVIINPYKRIDRFRVENILSKILINHKSELRSRIHAISLPEDNFKTLQNDLELNLVKLMEKSEVPF